jgi:hypothetical protein
MINRQIHPRRKTGQIAQRRLQASRGPEMRRCEAATFEDGMLNYTNSRVLLFFRGKKKLPHQMKSRLEK